LRSVRARHLAHLAAHPGAPPVRRVGRHTDRAGCGSALGCASACPGSPLRSRPRGGQLSAPP